MNKKWQIYQVNDEKVKELQKNIISINYYQQF